MMTRYHRRRLAIAIVALCSCTGTTTVPVVAQTILHDKDSITAAPDRENDPHKVVITDISAWHHPAKAVFARYKMTVTKVILVQDRKYPIFHVADFHADPRSSMTNAFFNRFNFQLLQANGYNGFTVVEDNERDGYRISFNKAKHTITSDLLVGEDS